MLKHARSPLTQERAMNSPYRRTLLAAAAILARRQKQKGQLCNATFARGRRPIRQCS